MSARTDQSLNSTSKKAREHVHSALTPTRRDAETLLFTTLLHLLYAQVCPELLSYRTKSLARLPPEKWWRDRHPLSRSSLKTVSMQGQAESKWRLRAAELQ